jgi:phosphopantothenoylcysteine decarboxylase/phosphopantothenate--cysteine ligase
MGFAIAEELSALGADVTLVSGPTSLNLSYKTINRIDVTSAEEMLQACLSHYANSHISVLSAAVADYRPREVANQKIKKDSIEYSLELIKTTDILASLGEQKKNGQLLIGFALETNNELENAIKKLEKKNLDFIVLNSMNDEGGAFKNDNNKITIIDKYKNIEDFELKPKNEVAADICRKIVNLLR